MSTPALSTQEISTSLKVLPGWELDDNKITKTYKFDSYLAGLAFATAVGTLAEAQNHHPDMMIGWRKVKVSFTTHDAGSKITQKDISMASAIESLGYPKKQE